MVKKTLVIAALAFAAFYLLTQPEDAAAAVRGAVEAVVDAFEQIVRFVTALVS